MTDIELALLQKEVENIRNQLNRIISHFESEERGRNRLAGNVDLLQKLCLDNKALLEKFDDMIRDSGKGLIWRVGNLERDGENNEKNWIKWVAILSAISTTGGWVYEIIKA